MVVFCACEHRGYLDITPYPAHEAAWEIVKAGALRQNEIFYPWYVYYGVLTRDWFPDLRDMAIRSSYNYQP